jgi:hypothetical protein
MELIPILSLIILVATISTFVLSIGAYVLYKVREKKGQAAEAPKPEAIPAELITPQVAGQTTRLTGTDLRRTYGDSQFRTTLGQDTSPMFRTNGSTRPEMRPTIVGNTVDEETFAPQPGRTTIQAERFSSTRGRFSRYTSTGYTDVEKNRQTKEDEEPLKWR